MINGGDKRVLAKALRDPREFDTPRTLSEALQQVGKDLVDLYLESEQNGDKFVEGLKKMGSILVGTVHKSNFRDASPLRLNHDLHAIDATPARRRGDASSSPLDRARAATSSPRNDLVKNCRAPDTLDDFHTGTGSSSSLLQLLQPTDGQARAEAVRGGRRFITTVLAPAQRRNGSPTDCREGACEGLAGQSCDDLRPYIRRRLDLSPERLLRALRGQRVDRQEAALPGALRSPHFRGAFDATPPLSHGRLAARGARPTLALHLRCCADGRHASFHAIDATCPSIFVPRERVATVA